MLTTHTGSAPRGTEIRHAVVMMINSHIIEIRAYQFKLRFSSVVRGTIDRIYGPSGTVWSEDGVVVCNLQTNAIIARYIKDVFSEVPYGREVPLFLINHALEDDKTVYQLVQSNITAPLNLQGNPHGYEPVVTWSDAATFTHQASLIYNFDWAFSRQALVLNARATGGTLARCTLHETKNPQQFHRHHTDEWETWVGEDFNQLIANGQWRNNKYCQLTLDGPHKTPVLVLVPRDIMSDDSAFNCLRTTIRDAVSTWPGYKFAKYVAEDPHRYNHSLFILEQFLLIPKRYAVVSVADSKETKIFVYMWLDQADTKVLEEEVMQIGEKVQKGDIRELQLYNPELAEDPELADTLYWHLHPLFEYTEDLLKEAGRPVPFQMVIKQGPLDKVLTKSLLLCLREFKHVDTQNPTVVDDKTPDIAEIARKMFESPKPTAAQKERPKCATTQKKPKRYVAILENIEDSLSISLYEDQVVGSVHHVKLCEGPIPYAKCANAWSLLLDKTVPTPLLVCSVNDLSAQLAPVPTILRPVWSTYPKDKIQECCQARDPNILLDMAYRFLTITVKHAIVLDAGSSGTRIFVYQWRDCIGSDGEHVLPDDINLPRNWNHKISKANGGIHELAPMTGGSNLASKTGVTAKKIADYLDPMFEYVKPFLPDETKSIPVFLLATAGMRLLGQTNLEGYNFLWKELNTYLNLKNYTIEECKLISGEEEGLYGWVAANFLSKTLKDASSTLCFVETGGASAQIAFHVDPNDEGSNEYNGPLTKIKLGGNDFHVFSSTWLGGGAQSVWKVHEEKMSESDTVIVHDPCLPIQYSYQLGKKTVLGTGDLDACMEEILSIIRPLEMTPDSPFFNRFLMKNAPKPNPKNRFLGASVFWHATHGVFGKRTDERGTYGLNSFHHDIMDLFANTWDEIKIKHPTQDPKHLKLAFFNAALVAMTLQYGYGVTWDGPRKEKIPSQVGMPTEPEPNFTDPEPKPINWRPTDPNPTNSTTNVNSIDATWTLGRAIIHAWGSTPEIHTVSRQSTV